MSTHPTYLCARDVRDEISAAVAMMGKPELVEFAYHVARYLEPLPGKARACSKIKTAAMILDCDNDYEGVV